MKILLRLLFICKIFQFFLMVSVIFSRSRSYVITRGILFDFFRVSFSVIMEWFCHLLSSRTCQRMSLLHWIVTYLTGFTLVCRIYWNDCLWNRFMDLLKDCFIVGNHVLILSIYMCYLSGKQKSGNNRYFLFGWLRLLRLHNSGRLAISYSMFASLFCTCLVHFVQHCCIDR